MIGFICPLLQFNFLEDFWRFIKILMVCRIDLDSCSSWEIQRLKCLKIQCDQPLTTLSTLKTPGKWRPASQIQEGDLQCYFQLWDKYLPIPPMTDHIIWYIGHENWLVMSLQKKLYTGHWWLWQNGLHHKILYWRLSKKGVNDFLTALIYVQSTYKYNHCFWLEGVILMLALLKAGLLMDNEPFPAGKNSGKDGGGQNGSLVTHLQELVVIGAEIAESPDLEIMKPRQALLHNLTPWSDVLLYA